MKTLPRPKFFFRWVTPNGTAESDAWPLRISRLFLRQSDENPRDWGLPWNPSYRPWRDGWLRGRGKGGTWIPRWYGLAYRDPDTATMVFYPIPINIIIAFVRWCRDWLQYEAASWFGEHGPR